MAFEKSFLEGFTQGLSLYDAEKKRKFDERQLNFMNAFKKQQYELEVRKQNAIEEYYNWQRNKPKEVKDPKIYNQGGAPYTTEKDPVTGELRANPLENVGFLKKPEKQKEFIDVKEGDIYNQRGVPPGKIPLSLIDNFMTKTKEPDLKPGRTNALLGNVYGAIKDIDNLNSTKFYTQDELTSKGISSNEGGYFIDGKVYSQAGLNKLKETRKNKEIGTTVELLRGMGIADDAEGLLKDAEKLAKDKKVSKLETIDIALGEFKKINKIEEQDEEAIKAYLNLMFR